MKNDIQSIPSLHDVAAPALHDAFLRAAALARQTRTYLVVQKEGWEVRNISYDEIDDFIALKDV